MVRKAVEDQSTVLASAIAFWAFFSVFPLLLVFVTLLGYFLPPSLQGDVLGRVAAFVPLLSTATIGHLSGQWWTLLLGIFSALWSGSFVVTTTQAAFNSVWELPYAQRPTFGAQMGRSLIAERDWDHPGRQHGDQQQLSSLIISRHLHTAERAYGNFATVLTMLWWFYLGSIVTLFGAQLNVVLKAPTMGPTRGESFNPSVQDCPHGEYLEHGHFA